MKALIAMSGGVDSSVAAYLIRQQGMDAVGCTMKLYDNEDAGVPKENTCCSLDDIEDARSVAYRLGMSYYVFNFKDDFKEKVIDNFICCYENGMTPNPCIECNRYLKFNKLMERAQIMECDYVVTGHYARIEKTPEGYVLKKAVDDSKDQSYVLYSLTQEQLAHTLFPLGELTKTQAREIAEKNGFINANKPDSQDICFVPDGDYAKVIRSYTGKDYPPGNYVSTSGEVLGTHKGIIHYTIGQRKGLGIALGEPRFVCGIRPDTNEVVLGTNEELMTTGLKVGDVNWILGHAPVGEGETFRCSAKARYKHKEQPATVTVCGDGTIEVEYDEPVRAATPGQSCVLYDGDVVIGGGKIF